MIARSRPRDVVDRIEFRTPCSVPRPTMRGAVRKRGIGAWLAMLVVIGWAELLAARFGWVKLREVVDLMVAQVAPVPVTIVDNPPAPIQPPAISRRFPRSTPKARRSPTI